MLTRATLGHKYISNLLQLHYSKHLQKTLLCAPEFESLSGTEKPLSLQNHNPDLCLVLAKEDPKSFRPYLFSSEEKVSEFYEYL